MITGPVIENEDDRWIVLVELIGYTIGQGVTLSEFMEEITELWTDMEKDGQ